VVPNLYPALKPAADGDAAQEPQPRPGANAARDLFWAAPALGAHEVIVNAPDPVMSLAELEVEQVECAVDVWRERMRTHQDAAYVPLIVSERPEPGAASLFNTRAPVPSGATTSVPRSINSSRRPISRRSASV